MALRMERITKIYWVVAILVMNTIVVMPLLELTSVALLRVDAAVHRQLGDTPTDPREKSSYYASQDWAPKYWREFALSRRTQYHAYTVWRRAPFKGETINIDERGVRRTPGADCQPKAFKVFTFGGSPMWGTGSPEWSTIPAYLQRGLEGQRHGPVCVTNFGESGYVSTQAVIELIMQLQAGNVPNVAIFLDGTNDIYTSYQSGKSGVHENQDQIAGRLERRNEPQTPRFIAFLKSLALYELVRSQLRGLNPGSQTEKLITYQSMGVDVNALSDAIVKTYMVNIENVAALARRYGFEYHFFWPPYISVGGKTLTSEESTLRASIDPALERLTQAVYKKIEPVVDRCTNLYSLTDIFDDYAPLVWLDDVHVTPEGNELIAEKMLQVVGERNAQ
jgi:lysophospholipase L1-like esterase